MDEEENRESPDPEWQREWRDVQEHRYETWHWVSRGSHPFFVKAGGIRTPGFGRGVVVVAVVLLIASLFLDLTFRTRLAIAFFAVVFLLVGIANVRHERRVSSARDDTMPPPR
ncbi:MAG TPA: hypothetical protein VNA69_21510 [Thermoanaerobaculia bacterium]|nr:hypothetical protein [Thermoanaerobaculia bacterium]